jgi:ribonuclease HIII
MTSHTCPLSSVQAEKLREILASEGYDFEQKPHSLFSARKGKLNVTVYQKGPKVLIQGKDTADFVRFVLEPRVTGEARLDYQEIVEPRMFEPHFGIDESGKGDFFGPLVIAGVYTDQFIARHLIDAGVRDSKRITSAARIKQLAATIRATKGCVAEVIAIGPERYNEMHASFGNLNRLLAWGHARVIEKLAALRPDCPRALSDQFANPAVLQRALREKCIGITLEQRTKAESDTAVAAASILARDGFLQWMEKNSAALGILLPFGASPAVIQTGRELVARHGREALFRLSKQHFRTTAEVLASSPAADVSPPDGTESASR